MQILETIMSSLFSETIDEVIIRIIIMDFIFGIPMFIYCFYYLSKISKKGIIGNLIESAQICFYCPISFIHLFTAGVFISEDSYYFWQGHKIFATLLISLPMVIGIALTLVTDRIYVISKKKREMENEELGYTIKTTGADDSIVHIVQ